MTPTEILKHEHEIILLVLAGAERELDFVQRVGIVHVDQMDQMLDFFRTFTDRCHHTKEEKHLFPLIRKRGLPSGCDPMAVMLEEHEQGRRMVKAMTEAIAQAKECGAPAVAEIRQNLPNYIGLLRAHIEKENQVLYPYADSVLSAKDQETLVEAFEKVETQEMGAGVHEKYHQLAHNLAEGKA